MKPIDKEIVLKIVAESEFVEISREKIDLYLKDIMRVPLIIEKNGRPIGFALLQKDKPRKGTSNLICLALERKHRGKGIGTKVLLKIIKMVKEKYCSNLIRLKIETKNRPTIALFKKVGFMEKKENGESVPLKEFIKKI